MLLQVLGEASRVGLAGLVLGGIAAVAASHMIQAGYHGIERLDAAALGGAAFVFGVSILAASALPAWRASRVDPQESLRSL